MIIPALRTTREELQRELDLLNALRPLDGTVMADDNWRRCWSGTWARVKQLLTKYADEEGY